MCGLSGRGIMVPCFPQIKISQNLFNPVTRVEVYHFFRLVLSSPSLDAPEDKFYLPGQEHRTSDYQCLCNCPDYTEDIQGISLTISTSSSVLL